MESESIKWEIIILVKVDIVCICTYLYTRIGCNIVSLPYTVNTCKYRVSALCDIDCTVFIKLNNIPFSCLFFYLVFNTIVENKS